MQNELMVNEKHTSLTSWDHPEKLDLLRRTIAKDVSNDEFHLFVAMARSCGLDPLQRQIYAVSRGGKMTVQTGIDGYRLIADRTGKHMGTTGPIFHIKENAKYPEFATVVVKKLVNGHIVEFEATCYWDEYAPVFNGKVGAMWDKMPRTMLGKVAEALALRRAFPANLSGIYTNEEMSQADNNEPSQHKAILKSVPIKIEEVKAEDNEELLETLLNEAGLVALNGMDELTIWFKELPPHEQALVKTHMASAKKVAINSDKSTKEAETSEEN